MTRPSLPGPPRAPGLPSLFAIPPMVAAVHPTRSALIAIALLVVCGQAGAAMYKCPGPGGRIEYTDHPCDGNPKTQPWRPKQPLNVVTSESLTGKKAAPVDARPGWLKPIDPIGDCKRSGGTFDPEFRACKMP